MSKAKPHILLLVAAADREKARAALEAAGHGPSNFRREMVARAADAKTGVVTHYACACPPYMADQFEAVLSEAGVAVKRHGGDLATPGWDKPLALREGVKPKEREIEQVKK